MKKLLILSDSHRNIQNMVEAVEIEKPDMIIHLGDHYRDAMQLAARFPDIPLEAVCGNCDFDRETEEKVILVENKRIFLCHGHRYHVKSGYLNLQYAAREKEADLVLFGHTPYFLRTAQRSFHAESRKHRRTPLSRQTFLRPGHH